MNPIQSILDFLGKEALTSELPVNYKEAVEKETDKEGVERARALARELLLVSEEPDNQFTDLTKKYLDILIKNGLPKLEGEPKKVLIVGAGITGLVAGSLLKQAGHEVTIIEANADRIGGRIKTFHKSPFNPGKPTPFKDPKQYAEAGAMRLPSFHPLVLALIDKYKLKRRYFYNVSIEQGTGNMSGPVPPVVYKPVDYSGEWRYGEESTWNPPRKVNNTWIRTNNIQVRKNEYQPEQRETVKKVNQGFEITGEDVSKTTAELLNEVLDPIRERYLQYMDDKKERPLQDKIREWIEAWASIIYDLDSYSMYGFLKKFAKKKNGERLTDNEIEAIGTLENVTSRLMLSFIHSFLGRADINPDVTYYEIEGGSWMLPYAFFPELYNNIVMNRRMTHIEYYDPERNSDYNYRFTSAKPGEGISVRTLSETKTGEGGNVYEEEIFKADVCLITIPFSSLRHVSVSPMFSYKKRRAIIELHYDAATKVLLEFGRRWWEFRSEQEWQDGLKAMKQELIREMGAEAGEAAWEKRMKLWKERDPRTEAEKDELIISHNVGGGNVTDNPNRFQYFPSHQLHPSSKGGVVLSSYSWSDDARRWDSMEEGERYIAALKGMVRIHGWQCAMFYTGYGKTQSWMRSPYAFGEAAVFTPGQMSSFHLDIPKPEGPVFFAGEHVSLKHAWIEGCLETGTQAALDIQDYKLPTE